MKQNESKMFYVLVLTTVLTTFAFVDLTLTILYPTTFIQQTQAQTHGNQSLSKYTITKAEVNKLTGAMNSTFGEPFYMLGNSQELSSEVLSPNPLQTSDTYKVNGTMKGVGKISETGTYVSTRSPGAFHSIGSGTVSTADGSGTAIFTAADQGKLDVNGTLLYKGIVFYKADPTGKLGFLNNKVGLYVYWQDANGNDWSKVWEWK